MGGRLLASILTLAAILGAGAQTTPSQPKRPQWERIAAGREANNIYSPDPEHPDVSVLRGTVYISVPEPVEAHVYTILGQTVAHTRLQPGVTTLRIPARGVYILKIGDTTRRISL